MQKVDMMHNPDLRNLKLLENLSPLDDFLFGFDMSFCLDLVYSKEARYVLHHMRSLGDLNLHLPTVYDGQEKTDLVWNHISEKFPIRKGGSSHPGGNGSVIVRNGVIKGYHDSEDFGNPVTVKMVGDWITDVERLLQDEKIPVRYRTDSLRLKYVSVPVDVLSRVGVLRGTTEIYDEMDLISERALPY